MFISSIRLDHFDGQKSDLCAFVQPAPSSGSDIGGLLKNSPYVNSFMQQKSTERISCKEHRGYNEQDKNPLPSNNLSSNKEANK